MASRKDLSDFLASVEKRAFKQAVYAVQNEASALDIVQDAMLKLAERYPHAPAHELPLLFQRILQNTIRDYYRRQKVRQFFVTLWSSLRPAQEEDDSPAPLEMLQVPANEDSSNPERWLARKEVATLIEEAIQLLPLRQREAFLLRYWEGLDVAETAQAMGCSEGSVKTHCSRATHTLAAILAQKGVML
ncbi:MULTISPECIES: RNA polymerase sigma factor [Gulbenkiania]|uniref:RNA polymerase, sigma-24 subunit, RpoE n=2 Tax=Gulbenkiania TaxID=397456 RepID=A0A0K6GTN4_9NEIS|nr:MULTISPECIES: RNA polymerase sigma factor [Gulbenkiania]TCW31881.1 RNA polymerase sigma-70 factor (ECF subfamily) [Gulbenkiania mobilis]CUA81977.1 RNA polymerase, sigma-24 subunit, RpoE [Gulbenkiania indica]